MKCTFTPSQAGEVLRAASLLPPAVRDQFFSAVDARLVGIPHRLTDDDVQSAIIATLSTLNVTHFMCDSKEISHADTEL